MRTTIFHLMMVIVSHTCFAVGGSGLRDDEPSVNPLEDDKPVRSVFVWTQCGTVAQKQIVRCHLSPESERSKYLQWEVTEDRIGKNIRTEYSIETVRQCKAFMRANGYRLCLMHESTDKVIGLWCAGRFMGIISDCIYWEEDLKHREIARGRMIPSPAESVYLLLAEDVYLDPNE